MNHELSEMYKKLIYPSILGKDPGSIIVSYIMDLHYIENKANVIHHINQSIVIYIEEDEIFWTNRYHIVPRPIAYNLYYMKMFLRENVPFYMINFDCNYFLYIICDTCRKRNPHFIHITSRNIYLDNFTFFMC